MLKKILWMGLIWLMVVVVYTAMAILIPVLSHIQVMMPYGSGLEAAGGQLINSSLYWIWFIPGGIGFCVSAYILKQEMQG